jgi:hypothetical protein
MGVNCQLKFKLCSSPRLVSTYLVHHGYSATAEVFAQTTGQPISEDLASIKNRQSTCMEAFYFLLNFTQKMIEFLQACPFEARTSARFLSRQDVLFSRATFVFDRVVFLL